LLEVSIKPIVGFSPLQLFTKRKAVADGKVSRIVRPQDTNRARYERRQYLWKFEPSYLNGVPLAVRVEFRSPISLALDIKASPVFAVTASVCTMRIGSDQARETDDGRCA